MPSPLAEAFLMGILNGCYETPSKCGDELGADIQFSYAKYQIRLCFSSLLLTTRQLAVQRFLHAVCLIIGAEWNLLYFLNSIIFMP